MSQDSKSTRQGHLPAILARTHACTKLHTHTRMQAHTRTYTHACTCTHAQMHAHTHARAHRHAHTHTHTHISMHAQLSLGPTLWPGGHAVPQACLCPHKEHVCGKKPPIQCYIWDLNPDRARQNLFSNYILPKSFTHSTLHAFQIRCKNSFGTGEFWQIQRLKYSTIQRYVAILRFIAL